MYGALYHKLRPTYAYIKHILLTSVICDVRTWSSRRCTLTTSSRETAAASSSRMLNVTASISSRREELTTETSSLTHS